MRADLFKPGTVPLPCPRRGLPSGPGLLHSLAREGVGIKGTPSCQTPELPAASCPCPPQHGGLAKRLLRRTVEGYLGQLPELYYG